MQRLSIKWKGRMILYSLLLGATILVQTFYTTNDYIRLWRAPLTRMSALDSFTRSGTIYLKPRGLKFMQFIDSIVPPGGNVTTTVNDSKFSSQNVLQFYLGNERTIISCPETGPKLAACLQDPNTYVTVMNDFPPKDIPIYKHFIPYQSTDKEFVGIYVPNDYSAGSYSTLGNNAYQPIPTLLLDLCILAGIAFIGCLIANLCLKKMSLVQALILSVPLGAGGLSWIIFLLSWAGVPLTRVMVLITFAGVAVVLIALRWLQTRPYFSLLTIDRPTWNWRSVMQKNKWFYILVGLLILFLGSAGLVIAIGRGYSLFDDLAIWGLKGYVMADHHDILAARWSSGHGLAYPLNLSLNVSVFRLISNDFLPGSKFIFFLLPAALFLGIYRFLRHYGVPTWFAILGVLGLLSCPIIYQHSTSGFANLPFTAYLVLGALYSIEGLVEKRYGSLMVGSLLLAFAGWTRPEGIGYAITIALALVIFQWLSKGALNPKATFLWLAAIVGIPGIWFIFSFVYVKHDQVGGALQAMSASIRSGSFLLENIGYITRYAIQDLQNISVWGIFLPAAGVILIISLLKIIRRPNPVALLLLPAALITILGPLVLFYVEFFQNTDYETFLMVSFARAFFPAAVFFTILSVTAAGYQEDLLS